MQPYQTLQIHFPGKLVFGKNLLPQIADEVLAYEPKSIFLATIEPILSTLNPFVESLKERGIHVIIDTSIVQEPSFSDFEKVMTTVTPYNPEVVLGIGGGSVLDVAKLVAAQLENDQTLKEYVGIGLLKGRKKALICVPTTAGTGSEVSPNAILVDDSDQQKKGIISKYLVPDAVFVDPVLSLSVPASITAATGIDALTHCMEAYTNKFATPFIDMYALEDIRLIAAHLADAVNDGNNEVARTEVAMGSLLGGFCLGPVNTAGVHALSYPLGSLYHLPHGLSNALLLPAVMSYNIPAAVDKYAKVAIALGAEWKESAEATAWAGVEKIKEIMKACGLPDGLKAIGVDETTIPQMAKDAMKIQRLLKNNPRPIEEEDAVKIFEAAM